MILDPLAPWLSPTPSPRLLLSAHHANTSTLSTHLLVQHIRAERSVTVVTHVQTCAQHWSVLLGKCGIIADEEVGKGNLRFYEFEVEIENTPDLDKLRVSVGKSDVVFLSDIHVLLGMGCELKEVVALVQKLIRDKKVVVATSRVAPETAQLNVYLSRLLGDSTCLDTLESGASAEVDGHVTRDSSHGITREIGLYKASERGVKVFPMGAAPGHV